MPSESVNLYIEKTIRRAIVRRSVTIFLLKYDAAFERLTTDLKDMYTRAWSDTAKSGIARALDVSRDLGTTIAKEDIDVIYKVLANDLGGDAMVAALRKPIINLGGALYKNRRQRSSG